MWVLPWISAPVGQQFRTVERKLARLATRSHGVVTRAQLLSAGISPKAIRTRLNSGALIGKYPGVYRVGHRAPSLEVRYLAAVLACGEGAELSGRAAAYLWGLVRGRAPVPEVTAPTERRVKGVLTRRCRRMDPRDQTVWRAIPKPPRPRPWSPSLLP
jgi:hypothetical protein